MDYEKLSRYALRQANIRPNPDGPTGPIDLDALLLHFGIRFACTPMDESIEGIFIRDPAGCSITVNAAKPYVRRRYTIGHEFGHFYMGHSTDVNLGETDRTVEVEANKFSACLLIPLDLLRIVNTRMSTVVNIASWFHVSPITCAYRLYNLGMRQYECEHVIDSYRKYNHG